MKKLFLLTAGLVASVSALAMAEVFHTPQGEAQSLFTADYGGVNYSTSQFTLFLTTVCPSYPCKGVWYGVLFSTGNTTDFVRVFDATSPVTAAAVGEVARLYNVSNSTVGAALLGTGAGFSGPPKPIRFNKGLFWQVSSNAYNSVELLYYKEP